MVNKPDPLQTVLDLLSTNWTSANTDNKTPTFIKVTQYKKTDFGSQQDWIIAQRANLESTPAGIGAAHKHESYNFNLDVKVYDFTNEQHWLNVMEEIKRILESKKISPSSDYLILEFDGNGPDLSDKNRGLWRQLIPIQLKRYNVVR